MDKTYHRIQQARLAVYLGTASIIFIFFMPVVMPYVMGSVAIVIAILSKGPEDRMSSRARKACVLASVGLALNTAMILISVKTMADAAADPVRWKQLNDMVYRMNGYTLDEVLSQLRSSLPF